MTDDNRQQEHKCDNHETDTNTLRELFNGSSKTATQIASKTDNVLGIKHRDLVEYTFKNGDTHRGYVTALYPELNALNFQSPTKHCKKVNAKKCKLLWKYSRIYWLDNTI